MRLFLFDRVKTPLKRIHSRLIIVMDNDTAGKKRLKDWLFFAKNTIPPFIMWLRMTYTAALKMPMTYYSMTGKRLLKRWKRCQNGQKILILKNENRIYIKKQPIKKISDNKQTVKNKKTVLEDYEQFEKYIDDMGSSWNFVYQARDSRSLQKTRDLSRVFFYAAFSSVLKNLFSDLILYANSSNVRHFLIFNVIFESPNIRFSVQKR